MADFIKEIVNEQDININDGKGLYVQALSFDEESKKSQYAEMIKTEQANIFNGYKIQSNHRFSSSKNDAINPKSLMRISSEFSSLRTNLPNNWDTSIVVRA